MIMYRWIIAATRYWKVHKSCLKKWTEVSSKVTLRYYNPNEDCIDWNLFCYWGTQERRKLWESKISINHITFCEIGVIILFILFPVFIGSESPVWIPGRPVWSLSWGKTPGEKKVSTYSSGYWLKNLIGLYSP